MEEANTCGVNHLDADTRLPPRKRLLAGLKKQNSDCPSRSLPLPSISSDHSIRLHDLLSSNSKSPHISPEEIVDVSRSAALAAAKAAAAAKATAEEKAAVAAKAVAAAKSALELVASFSEKKTHRDRCPRKNKPKKHVPVKLLYTKRQLVGNCETDEEMAQRQLVGNCETDEEMARRLHRAMNSSPRISKNSLSSDLKDQNHKKHRKQPTLEETRVSDGGVVWEHSPPSTCDRNTEASDMNPGENTDKVDEKGPECTKSDYSEMDSFPADGEAEASYLKEKYWRTLEDTSVTCRKRGRIKQKKLSLSLCTIRDRENSKEEPESRGFPSVEEPKGSSTATNIPLFPAKPSAEGEKSVELMWKFEEFPKCFAGSKILHSLCSNPAVTTGLPW